MKNVPKDGEDNVAKTGACLEIRYAIKENGKMPAKEFVDDSLSIDERVKVFKLFKVMVDAGKIRNKSKFRSEGDGIFAFKANQIRIPCFSDGIDWVVTHGFIKKKDKWPKEEKKRAVRIREEHLSQSEHE